MCSFQTTMNWFFHKNSFHQFSLNVLFLLLKIKKKIFKIFPSICFSFDTQKTKKKLLLNFFFFIRLILSQFCHVLLCDFTNCENFFNNLSKKHFFFVFLFLFLFLLDWLPFPMYICFIAVFFSKIINALSCSCFE